MISLIIFVLVVLWLLGYLSVNNFFIPNIILFSLNGHPITLWNLLIFLVIVTAIGSLPRPFQAIGTVLLLLWILSVLGIIAVAGFSNLVILAIVVGLIIFIIQG